MSGAVVLTIDNLGEASELERGTWANAQPLGRHPSVTVALPRLLDTLDRHGLSATFCVEALNCELNPAAVRAIADAGHELAVHGWRHEAWATLDPAREPGLLDRSLSAYRRLGLRPRGFRPPGGRVGPRTLQRIREAGFAWCSPDVGSASTDGPAGAPGGPALVGFDWAEVDAYHLMDGFAELRGQRGDDRASCDASETARRIRAALAGDPPAGGAHVLVLHPFLMLEPAWWAEVESLLGELARARDEDGLVCLTAGNAASGW